MAASANDTFMKVAIATATTLDAPGYTIGDPSITVASTSTWPTDTGITFAIDTVDANGDRVAGSYNEYVGTVASGTSITNVSHVNGTDQNYSAGATTRVYIPVSEERENRLVAGILVEHDQDGTHGAITPTSITSAGTIAGVGLTSSNGITMSAGSLSLTGTVDGWIGAGETWTYVSGTGTNEGVFKISGVDLTGKYQVGDRVKFTQTQVKYGIITKVAFSTDTSITVLMSMTSGTVDNSGLTNTTISANYYSRQKNPFGFPIDPARWTIRYTYTDDNSTTSATYAQVGAHQITMPTGAWATRLKTVMSIATSGNNTGVFYTGLSTSTNSASDVDLIFRTQNPGVASLTSNLTTTAIIQKDITVASSTVYYHIFKRTNALTCTISGTDTDVGQYIEIVSRYL